MRPAGLAAIESAKSDGRWDRAYAGSATVTVPDDFAEALTGNEVAANLFDGINQSNRYSVLWRIESLKLRR